jgi:hypothetical protein
VQSDRSRRPFSLPISYSHIISDASPTPTSTAAVPAVFDGHADVAAFREPRDSFRVEFVLVVAIFASVAALLAAMADVLDVRTSRPAAGISSGVIQLNDLAGNLGPAAVFGATIMLAGGLLACFGLRWGAGLAGGAGLALGGWAALTLGLVEVPASTARSITRASNEAYTLTVTRDVGWWLVMAVGVMGLIVFFGSLRSVSRGGRRALNPLLAAFGALCALVLASGPLVPVGDGTWRDNFSSPTAAIDLPTLFFVGRIAQVGLIAIAGVVGMLLVRNYGLGLAAGGVSVALWLWVTSIAELGWKPTGIAERNPGATSTVPHDVTTVGMVSTLVVVILAAIVATLMEMTGPPEPSR